MDDLIAFLNARLDEDEAAFTTGAALADDPVAEDLCRRLLREVEADRDLVVAYQRSEAKNPMSGWESDYTQALMLAVKIRTAIYSDHPDYRAEWKP